MANKYISYLRNLLITEITAEKTISTNMHAFFPLEWHFLGLFLFHTISETELTYRSDLFISPNICRAS